MLAGWCGLISDSEAGSPGVRTEPGAGAFGVITLTGVPREAGELMPLVPRALASRSFLTEPGGPMDSGLPLPALSAVALPPAPAPTELAGPSLPGILSEAGRPE